MPDRTVTARLRLLHDEYTKGAREAAKSTRGIGDEADKTTKRTQGSWARLGQATADLGDRMTTRLTLPLVAAAGAMVKMASDFDATFVQMQTLAGVSADEVDRLKESVLGLAAETGKAPQELAEALYFIRSAGLAGSDALDALEMSAKGAAAGLGSTIQVADAVTSAMNGYGADVLSAAEATDVLVKTAQEGKAEASELAPQFGRLIPLASELGISFDQVGAGLAFFTRSSGDASLAATQFNGILSKLMSPGIEGEEALGRIGLTIQEFRKSVRDQGLLPALVNLRSELEANGMEMKDFSIDNQFLQGVLQLTANEGEAAGAVFESLADSAGATDEAFSKWAESMGAENARAWAKAQAALISFGDVAMPMVGAIVDKLATLVEMFGDLPEGVQQVILVMGGLAAALGPVASTAGRLIKAWQGMSKIGELAGGFAAAGAGAFVLAVGLGAVLLAFNEMINKQQQRKQRISELADELERGGRQAKMAADEFLTNGLVAGELGQKVADAGVNLRTFTDDMRKGAEQSRDLQETLQQTASRDSEAWRRALGDAADAGDEFAQQIEKIVESQGLSREETLNLLENMSTLSDEYAESAERAKANAVAQDEVAASAAEAGLAIDEQGNLVDATEQQIEELTGALDELLSRFLTVDESVRRQNELVIGLEEHFKKLREEYGNNALALDDNTAAGIANSDMLDDLIGASSDTISKMIEQGATSEDLRAQWAQDRLELAAVIQKFRDAGQDVSDYDALLAEIDRFVATTISTPGLSGANRALGDLIVKVKQADGSEVNITVNVNERRQTSTGRHGGVPVFAHSGGVIPGRRGEEVAAVLLAGERVLAVDDPVNKALSGQMTSALDIGGRGGGVVVRVDMRGAIVSSERQFNQMVSKAWNKALRTTRALNAA